MKLKDSTFAIIAEKKDSISHKWVRENSNAKPKWDYLGEYTVYDKGHYLGSFENQPENIPIYTESEFEALLKAEQENEALKTAIWENSEIPTTQNAVMTYNPSIPQITISYNLALEYIAERLNVDKGIIKIEMP